MFETFSGRYRVTAGDGNSVMPNLASTQGNWMINWHLVVWKEEKCSGMMFCSIQSKIIIVFDVLRRSDCVCVCVQLESVFLPSLGFITAPETKWQHLTILGVSMSLLAVGMILDPTPSRSLRLPSYLQGKFGACLFLSIRPSLCLSIQSRVMLNTLVFMALKRYSFRLGCSYNI